MKHKRKKFLKMAGVVLLLIIALRLALPYIVLNYVNKVLANMNGYAGHVEDIEISLLRGAYTIEDIVIDRKEKQVKIPFFKSNTIDLSIEWKSVWKGALVGEVEMREPVLNFVAAASNGQENDWKEPVKKLFPLRINTMRVINGQVHYRDYTVSPDLNLYMRSISATVTNLTNSDELSKTMVATLNAKGIVMKNGTFSMRMQLDPLAHEPTFDLDARMEKMNATELNDFFKAYGKFDVQDGSIGLYTEAAASGGKIKGYVKPLIDNLNVLKPKEEKPGPLKFIYEGMIEGLGELFKNQPADRVATRVEFAGDLKDPKVNIWTLVVNILRNAFVDVLLPGIDQTISLGDSKGDEEKQKKEDKKKRKAQRKEEKEKKN